DLLFTQNETLELDIPRFPTAHTHGTGCTISARITAESAKGSDVCEAVQTAKAYITAAISNPLEITDGHGPVNHGAHRD
ncbi:bifunctional hydroxymethylpyrimidine kinase/phosphomethylpyrimidine kinase, partial [Neisseria meningitidis]|uniref:bifunctional hydroxymethylpyrimidine kinase/phosphomethylpyrimidine kinase n=1 Tax=Neisseria meningitidis TaxID=487 RepID=UPI000CBFBEE3